MRRWASGISRFGGFIAIAALILGAVLLERGYLHPALGVGGLSKQRFTATAIDGDSLRTVHRDIRLEGIDAPELFQTCIDEHGSPWACGRQAHAFLRALVSRGLLTCASRSTDRYGRTLATCSVGGVGDLGEAMVRAGLAVSYGSIGYWAAEFDARRHKRGIWRGTFERPQDWRRRQRRAGSG